MEWIRHRRMPENSPIPQHLAIVTRILRLATAFCNPHLATRNPHLATCNHISRPATASCDSQPASRDSQPASRNPHLATCNHDRILDNLVFVFKSNLAPRADLLCPFPLRLHRTVYSGNHPRPGSINLIGEFLFNDIKILP